jgi:prepilin-type N-terminal cleavage/methylation domain-containing protein
MIMRPEKRRPRGERCAQESRARRGGFTLVELLVTLVLTAVLGGAAMRLFLTQSRFFDLHFKQQSARSVSRAAVNGVLSDLRMVEAPNGVTAATTSSITVRVPYAFGVVCATTATYTTVAFLPVDSLTLANAALSGYAYRGSSGAYTLTEGGVSTATGSDATCTGATITPITGGNVLNVSPAMAAAATAGTPVYLYQRVRYAFAASTAYSGRTGLWRTLMETGATEEIAAPFNASSGFEFYDLNAGNASSTTVPTLANIRGIELVFNGESEKPRFGGASPEKTSYRTAVFFMNGNR